MTNEVGILLSQSYSNSLVIALFVHETGDQLFSETLLHQQGQKAQIMTTAFSQPASCCTVEQKMGMEGQGEREVRISAKLTFIQILHSSELFKSKVETPVC